MKLILLELFKFRIDKTLLLTGEARGDELFAADLGGEEGLAVGAGGLRQVPHLAVAEAQL